MVADTAFRDGVRGLFDGLIPPELIDAYDRLLATDGCAKDQAETLVGDPGLVSELTDWGMARIQPHTPADPAWLRPASPDLALQGVLAGHQHRLARDQELLLAGHHRLAAAQARYGVNGTARFPGHLVRVIQDRDEIAALSAALANTARQDWMSLDTPHTEMPLTSDFADLPLPAHAGQVRYRSIYQASMMNNPAARQIIQSCAQAGEQGRLLPEIPMKLKLADHTTALVPLTPTGTAGALLIQAPVIVAALRGYFEMLWERATPIGTAPAAMSGAGTAAGDRPTPAQQQILQLMAEGLADDAIARRAGVSTTTVRRHITAILDKLAVTSRFAAGAAAQRRGWIQ